MIKKILFIGTLLSSTAFALDIDKNNVDLGELQMGAPFSERRLVSFVVKNNEASQAEGLSVSLTQGIETDQGKMFSIIRNSCSSSLPAGASCSILIKAQPAIEGDQSNPSYVTPEGAISASFSVSSSQGVLPFSIDASVNNVVALQQQYPIDVVRNEALDQKYSANFKDSSLGDVQVICPAATGDTAAETYCDTLGSPFNLKDCQDYSASGVFPHKECGLVLQASPKSSDKLFELKLSHHISLTSIDKNTAVGENCSSIYEEGMSSGYYLLNSSEPTLTFCAFNSSSIVGFTDTLPLNGELYSSITNRKPIVKLDHSLLPNIPVERVLINSVTPVQGESHSSGTVYKTNDKKDRIRVVGSAVSALSGFSGDFVMTQTGSFFEVTFYGTGLNMLYMKDGQDRSMSASLNGEAAVDISSQLNLGNQNLLEGIGYAIHQGVEVFNNLPLGYHTVKIQSAASSADRVYGFEILNNSSNLAVNEGKVNFGKYNSLENTALQNLTLPTDMPNGGSVVLALEKGKIVEYKNAIPSNNTDMIENGDFSDSNLYSYNWANISEAGATAPSVVNERLFFNKPSGGNPGVAFNFDTEIGKYYKVSFDKHDLVLHAGSSNLYVRAYSVPINNSAEYVPALSHILYQAESNSLGRQHGRQEFVFKATTTRSSFSMMFGGGNGSAYVDNVKLEELSGEYFSDVDHSNEEEVETHVVTEFGTTRSDDFTQLNGSSKVLAHTKKDGTTTLVGYNVRDGGLAGRVLPNAAGDFFTFTFIGTGLDYSVDVDTTFGNDLTEIYVDGHKVSIGMQSSQIYAGAYTSGTKIPVVSNLPYGTHTVRWKRGSGSGTIAQASRFHVYAPKKLALPQNSVEIASYYKVADFKADMVRKAGVVSQGVLRKYNSREFTFKKNGWTYATNAGYNGYETPGGRSIQITNTNGAVGATIEHTFVGTGLGFVVSGYSNQMDRVDISIDGNSNFSNYDTTVTGGMGVDFDAATGDWDQTPTSDGQPVSMSINGLPYGVHTVKLTGITPGSGTVGFRLNALDVVNPVHKFETKMMSIGYSLGKSCNELIARDPSLQNQDGFYHIEKDNGDLQKVYCDMTTDGGGWTLFANFGSNDRFDNKGILNDGGRMDHGDNNVRPKALTAIYTHDGYGGPNNDFYDLHYTGSTTGYVEFSLPSWATEVRTKWRHHYNVNSSYVTVNGAIQNTITTPYGESEDTFSLTGESNRIAFVENNVSIVGIYYIFVK